MEDKWNITTEEQQRQTDNFGFAATTDRADIYIYIYQQLLHRLGDNYGPNAEKNKKSLPCTPYVFSQCSVLLLLDTESSYSFRMIVWAVTLGTHLTNGKPHFFEPNREASAEAKVGANLLWMI